LVGQCHVDYHCWLKLPYEAGKGRNIFGIYGSGGDVLVASGFHSSGGYHIALRFCAAGQEDFTKNFGMLCAFINHYTAYAASTND
jgi:hypothetical protein